MTISNPYPHKKGYRCRIKTPSGEWRNAPSAPTEAEAQEVARQALGLLQDECSQQVGSCIETYLEHHRDRGTRERSLTTYRQMLTRFFASVSTKPLGYVTAARAAGLYEQLRKSCGAKTGKPLSVDTHRNMLTVARGFLAWCKSRRWIRTNPLQDVKGVGSKKRGKQQPTIDEGKTLWEVCLREAEGGDAGALVAAMALSMGCRGGELVSRTVRDLDNKDEGGMPRHLRIADQEGVGFRTKTRSSKRPVLIPEELRPLLVAQARDKLPTALLFPSATGGLQWVSWVNRQVHRLCKLAGIPPVCAHSLRGFSADTAAAEGESPQVVARALGHANPGVTLGHYIKRGTVEAAQAAQGLRVLRGGK